MNGVSSSERGWALAGGFVSGGTGAGGGDRSTTGRCAAGTVERTRFASIWTPDVLRLIAPAQVHSGCSPCRNTRVLTRTRPPAPGPAPATTPWRGQALRAFSWCDLTWSSRLLKLLSVAPRLRQRARRCISFVYIRAQTNFSLKLHSTKVNILYTVQ